MSKIWGPDPVGSTPPGKPCIEDKSGGSHSYREYYRDTVRGMRRLDWIGTPRQVALRLIDSYQRNSSDGADRCGKGAGRNCSLVGRRYVERYGAVQGVALAIWVVATCGVAMDSDCEDMCNGCGKC